MCLELVRTRAFAALLSDEVFSDVDLETVQVNDRYLIHRRGFPVLCQVLRVSLIQRSAGPWRWYRLLNEKELFALCTKKEDTGYKISRWREIHITYYIRFGVSFV